MSTKSKRSSVKTIDYSKLHAVGLTDMDKVMDKVTCSDYEDIGNAQSIEDRMQTADDMDCRLTPQQKDRFIHSMRSELGQLEQEEEQLRIAIQIEEKRRNIELLKQQLHSSSTRSSAGSEVITRRENTMNFDGNQSGTGASNLNNPRVYLQGTDKKSVKYRKIVDYIPKRSRLVEEEIKVGDGVFLKLDSGTGKVKVDQITPSQWVVANSSILAEMIAEELTGPNSGNISIVLDYLSYSAKIGDLGGRFTWSSVMINDDKYKSCKHVKDSDGDPIQAIYQRLYWLHRNQK